MKVVRIQNIVILIGLMIIVGAAATFPSAYTNRHSLLQSPVVQLIIPLYHSIRKIPDIFFIPATIFSQSKLERYELFIPEDNVAEMNAALPARAFTDTLEDKHKVWVSAEFRAPGYTDTVKVRYRGNLANHWNSYKKSYLVKFPRDNLFRGMRELSLIIPVDRKYFSTALNNYRAKKMGLLVPEEYFAHLSVNGGANGVYLALEHWSQELIEKQPVSSLSTLYGVNDLGNTIDTDTFSAYENPNTNIWKSWNSDKQTFPEIEALSIILTQTTDEEFERQAPILLDLDAFYAQDTLAILTGGYHISDDGNNIILLFDRTEGRFKPVPFNAGLSSVERGFSINAPLLQKRLWTIPTFAAERDGYFTNYVAENMEDDIAFVDRWIEDMSSEFYRDNAKLENNFMFRKNIAKYREDVLFHTTRTTNVLLDDTPVATSSLVGLSRQFPSEFKYIQGAADSIEEFTRKHPYFRMIGNTIVLPRGTYVFNETVIIPRNTTLIISPGTTLRMKKDVSIVSYSPVLLRGTNTSPIIFDAHTAEAAWGTFAIINAETESSISHTTFRKGSATTINGVLFSGMLAFHNADSAVTHNTFTNVRGEDAVNIKGSRVTFTDNLVQETSADGLDLDYVHKDSIIERNTFTNIGGDAIDVSWNTTPITENVIAGCGDKGISIGERSTVEITENIITNCAMGIAVKDQSNAQITNNTIRDNTFGIAVYKKKPVFGGAHVTLSNNTVSDNTQEFLVDTVSTVTSGDIKAP